jgi:hypothetical protein
MVLAIEQLLTFPSHPPALEWATALFLALSRDEGAREFLLACGLKPVVEALVEGDDAEGLVRRDLEETLRLMNAKFLDIELAKPGALDQFDRVERVRSPILADQGKGEEDPDTRAWEDGFRPKPEVPPNPEAGGEGDNPPQEGEAPAAIEGEGEGQKAEAAGEGPAGGEEEGEGMPAIPEVPAEGDPGGNPEEPSSSDTMVEGPSADPVDPKVEVPLSVVDGEGPGPLGGGGKGCDPESRPSRTRAASVEEPASAGTGTELGSDDAPRKPRSRQSSRSTEREGEGEGHKGARKPSTGRTSEDRHHHHHHHRDERRRSTAGSDDGHARRGSTPREGHAPRRESDERPSRHRHGSRHDHRKSSGHGGRSSVDGGEDHRKSSGHGARSSVEDGGGVADYRKSVTRARDAGHEGNGKEGESRRGSQASSVANTEEDDARRRYRGKAGARSE